MKPPNLLICIGVPQPELSSHWFNDCLLHLIFECQKKGISIVRYNAVGSVIASNRNRIVQFAKEVKATHLLQIDSDQTFPPYALERLLAHDRDIIGATTCARAGDDTRPLCDPLSKDRVANGKPVIPVRLIGCCFMLTKMEVFEKLRSPYFADPPRWMMDIPKVTNNDPELVAEDEYFCYNVQKAGYTVYCDMALSMEVGHIGPKIHHIK